MATLWRTDQNEREWKESQEAIKVAHERDSGSLDKVRVLKME